MLTQRLLVDAVRSPFSTAASVVTRRSACSVLHHAVFRRRRLTKRPPNQAV